MLVQRADCGAGQPGVGSWLWLHQRAPWAAVSAPSECPLMLARIIDDDDDEAREKSYQGLRPKS